MAKQKRDHEMTAERWLERSRLTTILNAIRNDPYIKAWGAITSHFARIEILTWDDALIALHLAYSWMPTIPKLEKTFSLAPSEHDEVVRILNRIRQGGELPNREELELLKRLSNNSIIGASKLLHFIAPDRCPIWDKRVAQSFFWDGVSDANQISRYEAYRSALSDWLKISGVLSRIFEMQKDASLPLSDATPLRILELVLFEQPQP